MSLTQEQKTEILSIKAPVVDARDQRIMELEEALRKIVEYQGKAMLGPTEELCAQIYERFDGWDCYRQAFQLGSYNSYSELCDIAEEVLARKI